MSKVDSSTDAIAVELQRHISQQQNSLRAMNLPPLDNYAPKPKTDNDDTAQACAILGIFMGCVLALGFFLWALMVKLALINAQKQYGTVDCFISTSHPPITIVKDGQVIMEIERDYLVNGISYNITYQLVISSRLPNTINVPFIDKCTYRLSDPKVCVIQSQQDQFWSKENAQWTIALIVVICVMFVALCICACAITKGDGGEAIRGICQLCGIVCQVLSAFR